MNKKLDKLIEALSKAKCEMPNLTKDTINPFLNSKYADLASVLKVIDEPFLKHGLCVTQVMEVLDTGRTVLKTLLVHDSGQYLESSMLLPDLIDPQKIGSSITYFRRYSLMCISGISPVNDDDGNAASKEDPKKEHKKHVHTISAKKTIELTERLNQYPDYFSQVKKYLKGQNVCIKDLTLESAKRIEAQLDKRDSESIVDFEVSHG